MERCFASRVPYKSWRGLSGTPNLHSHFPFSCVIFIRQPENETSAYASIICFIGISEVLMYVDLKNPFFRKMINRLLVSNNFPLNPKKTVPTHLIKHRFRLRERGL